MCILPPEILYLIIDEFKSFWTLYPNILYTCKLFRLFYQPYVTQVKDKIIESIELGIRPVPKGVKTPYIIYSMENRERIKRENPGADNRSITRLLTEEQRKPYKLQERHNIEVYLSIELPRAPQSPYNLFCTEKRDKLHPLMNGSRSLGHLLKEIWHQLPDTKTQKYIDKSVEDKERHEKEMQEYKSGPGAYYKALREVLKHKK